MTAVAGPWSGVAAANGRGHDQEKGEELVLVNGRIHTMDDRNSVVSSVVIRNNRFVHVGHGYDEHRARDSKPRVIDLQRTHGGPGPHREPHPLREPGNRPGYHVAIENGRRSIAEIQAVLAARRPDVPPGEFITSMGGWHTNMFAEHRLPTLAELDAAVPDRPVFLYQTRHRPVATNSLGKAFFETVVSPLAGPIAVGADGSIASGIGVEHGALPPARPADVRGQGAQHARRDDVLGQHRPDRRSSTRCCRPSPGPINPSQSLSDLDHYRMYDPWLAVHREGKTLVRLQTNFLHNQNDLGAARAAASG